MQQIPHFKQIYCVSMKIIWTVVFHFIWGTPYMFFEDGSILIISTLRRIRGNICVPTEAIPQGDNIFTNRENDIL